MLLDISDVLKNQGQAIDVLDTVDLSQYDFSRLGVAFSDPVSVKGILKNAGGILMLEAEVAGVYHTVCDRCGAPVTEKLSYQLEENFAKGEDSSASGKDIIVLEDYLIDLTEVVGSHTFSEIPLKHLCSPDCKGLCAGCGKNLNEGPCTCKVDYWNPQFDVLKQLFDESNEEV